ncbi:hypothetical protein [Streptomyces sp. NL15-2K]|uniref:hypothetical protein n=1 Tax=Streptomyces sp. NL15-2K TaxID=376149 RepID=UPI000F57F0C8|nr:MULTISPECIES: hypothetical protein [Actinomycetes]WKX08551.1 hypothetical protein Q4V64_14080 [Kutzneria buriramensis]GCB49976.1 hypothetical protein SNL152K_7319 [Streptomyces sp. NL15-2K]
MRVPPLLLKILITALVAVLAYVLTNLIDQKQGEMWKLTVSIVIGGATLIVQYLVDFERRLTEVETGQVTRIREMKESLAAHHGAMRDLVDDRFARISEATELFSQVDRSVLRSDGVTKLARSATKVGHLENPLVEKFADLAIGRLATLMEDLSSRRADCLGENDDWMIDLTKCVQSSLVATSTSVDRGFWNSEPAKRYLEAQSDAIGRGVKVRRLFVVNTPEDIDSELEEICESQKLLNIDACIVALSELPHRVQLGTTSDFIVFDEVLSYETGQDTLDVNAKTTLDARPEHVSRCLKRFNELWGATQNLASSRDPR